MNLTFIISRSVLNTMSIIIKYSNGVDTTIRHTLYLKLFRSFGMYRSSGLAPIVKSMHDFCSGIEILSISFQSKNCNKIVLKFKNWDGRSCSQGYPRVLLPTIGQGTPGSPRNRPQESPLQTRRRATSCNQQCHLSIHSDG